MITDQPRPDPFNRLHFFLGIIFLGLQFGSWLYYAITGLRPPSEFLATSATSMPWMLFFCAMRAAMVFLTNGLLRLGWVVSLAALLLSWTALADRPGLMSWSVREALITLSGCLFVVGGASGAQSIGLRTLAVVLLVAVIPFRYYVIKHWHDLTGRTTIMGRED